jgi:hypothetical protein
MQPLPRPSVSPLPSYASIPTGRQPSFAETVRAVLRWFTNRQLPPSKGELFLEQRIIERLAVELQDEISLTDAASDEMNRETSLTQPERPRRNPRSAS